MLDACLTWRMAAVIKSDSSQQELPRDSKQAVLRRDASFRALLGGYCRQPRRFPPTSGCVSLKDPPEGPDLATYSQGEQFALGVQPTWDSPDIVTNTSAPPFGFLTQFTVVARNLSQTVSAVQAEVSVSTSDFGIGTIPQPLSTQVVTFAQGQQLSLTYPITQALLQSTDQRAGVHVDIHHPADIHLQNNQGAQQVGQFQSSVMGRSFSVQFPAVNPLSFGQQITFVCLPNQLGATITPDRHTFAALEQINASLSLSIPASVHGTSAAPVRSDVTVAARNQDGSLLDGLTCVVWVDT